MGGGDMNPEEAAFLEGYDRGETIECNTCGMEIEKNTAIKKEIEDEMKYFCSRECQEEFLDNLELGD